MKSKADKKLDNKKPVKESLKSKGRENFEAVVIAIILALLIRTFFFQAFKIPSGSMMDTLLVGDHILVNKFVYGFKIPFIRKDIVSIKDPGRDDIVVFIYPFDKSKDFIKRVVGIPGDVVECRNRNIYINNVQQEKKMFEKHTEPIGGFKDNFGPLKVPENYLFVMGDNRENSHDSRFWGINNRSDGIPWDFVPRDYVKGKAFIIYWSWNNSRFSGISDIFSSVRWKRIGDLLK